MSILSFFRRRTLSRYADDKAVADFERVAQDKGLIDPVDELAALMAKNDPTPADVEKIGKLLGGA